jgi:hypothetical protein
MSKTEFTKEQLKEIEKIFDIQASMLSSSYAHLFNSIASTKVKNSTEILTKLMKEYVDAFDTYRTISAKADAMQEEEKNDVPTSFKI